MICPGTRVPKTARPTGLREFVLFFAFSKVKDQPRASRAARSLPLVSPSAVPESETGTSAS